MITNIANNLIARVVRQGRILFFSGTADMVEMLPEFSVYLEKIMSLMSLGILSQDVWKYLGGPYDGGKKNSSTWSPLSENQKQASFNLAIVERVTYAVLQGKRVTQGLQEALHEVAQSRETGFLNRKKRRASLEAFNLLSLWWDLSLCWKISESYGVPLKPLLEVFHTHVEDSIKLGYRRITALSGPIMTVKIMLVLPFVALVMTACLGMGTISFLAGAPLGWLCCVCAVGALVIARRWAGTMIVKAQNSSDSRKDLRRSHGWKAKAKGRRSEGASCRHKCFRGRVVEDIALVIDLLGGLLECGMSLDMALEVLEQYAKPEILQEIKAVEWGSQRKRKTDEHERIELDAIISLIALCRKVGVPSKKMLTSHAQWLRRKRRYEMERKLEALGVKIVLPLGVCVLPAFFCLSVVPVVVALTNGIF